MDTGHKIAAVNDVPHDTTYVFTIEEVDSGEQKEAILLRDDDSIYAWLNYCQHYTHIKLDKGSGAEMRNGEIVCTNHAAYFEQDTGVCTYGPCEGAYLNDVEVSVEDGDIYLSDDDFEFVQEGPIAEDEVDLESKSNYKF